MIKIILIITLVLSVFLVASPYLPGLITGFSTGLGYITEYIELIVDWLTDISTSFSQYYYLTMIFYIFLSFAIIKLIINNLVGGN